MERSKRLAELEKYVWALNRDVSDLPYNLDRFCVVATPKERGYEVTFLFVDTWTFETRVYKARWCPMITKSGGIYVGMDIFDRFNTFVIERRAYK
jgi:hypothetical protein